jgi:hypothetical protein
LKIKYSRHAQRRISLYKIPESLIEDIINKMNLSYGKQTIISKVDGFDLPIKIVCDISEDGITVITAYLLKRGKKS